MIKSQWRQRCLWLLSIEALVSGLHLTAPAASDEQALARSLASWASENGLGDFLAPLAGLKVPLPHKPRNYTKSAIEDLLGSIQDALSDSVDGKPPIFASLRVLQKLLKVVNDDVIINGTIDTAIALEILFTTFQQQEDARHARAAEALAMAEGPGVVPALTGYLKSEVKVSSQQFESVVEQFLDLVRAQDLGEMEQTVKAWLPVLQTTLCTWYDNLVTRPMLAAVIKYEVLPPSEFCDAIGPFIENVSGTETRLNQTVAYIHDLTKKLPTIEILPVPAAPLLPLKAARLMRYVFNTSNTVLDWEIQISRHVSALLREATVHRLACEYKPANQKTGMRSAASHVRFGIVVAAASMLAHLVLW
mmetsp:Transcript_95529/g.270040  ORF Transcript_95529/g.270040 Transcript_95529/m.270040 type:complete len:362 (-) Transcript_95529:270-1355(-)